MQMSGCQGVFSARPDPGRPLYQAPERPEDPSSRGPVTSRPATDGLEEESDTKCRSQRVP